ncbi:disease resistance RPP13-like protein 4 [Pistacia vera]|uniref:disease resistance RPP13-like protein 4 n=1 Tax=Pistacia vera TaxID=55513 RepID=UPI001263D721|nr:disease resistance RPP13-like protein 4 [Pistacia vera]
MRTKLELMRAFLSAENLGSNGNDLKMVLLNMRKLIYEADDILTDCQIRGEYRNMMDHQPATGDSHLAYPWRSKGLINGGYEAYQNKRYFPGAQDYDPSEPIGLQNDIKKIKNWLFTDQRHRQFGIVGMGGLGKTTIAQEIFNDRDVIKYFDETIWVPVSNNFSTERIMRVMLKQLGEEGSRFDEGCLLRKIREKLGTKKSLIVMDDVWRMETKFWSSLCNKHSIYIIISRNEAVIKLMGVDNSRIHRPRLLDEEESWSLFCKFAFDRSNGKCPNNHLEKEGREILHKCKGLPLAIKTIGALLAPKLDSLTEWNKIHQDFLKLAEEENNSIMPSLQLSYDELPTHLKQCLLCFSIYPEDIEIDTTRLDPPYPISSGRTYETRAADTCRVGI